MKTLQVFKLWAALTLLGSPALSAQVLNGDFSSYGPTDGNGYGPIADFTASGGHNSGVNGNNTGFGAFNPGAYGGNIYQVDPSIFAFIQNQGSLSQDLTLAADEDYTLTFSVSARFQNSPTGSIVINAGGLPVSTTLLATGVNINNTDFVPFSIDFTTGLDASNASIFLNNTSGTGGDNSIEFANVVLTDEGPGPVISSTPEPSSWALMGLGALAILGVRRFQKAKV